MKILWNFNNKELYFILYLLIINLLAFITFALDKRKAMKKDFRVPEATLLFLSLLGGGLGGLMAMVIFKHKLSKKLFYIGLPVIIISNIIIELMIINYIK